MKYMLLIYMGENAMSETERESCYKDSMQLAHDLKAAGKYLSANPLQPAGGRGRDRIDLPARMVAGRDAVLRVGPLRLVEPVPPS